MLNYSYIAREEEKNKILKSIKTNTIFSAAKWLPNKWLDMLRLFKT